MMYKIYYADLGKATGVKEIGRRPVVVVGQKGDKLKCYKVTSRMRNDFRHIRLNSYMVSGYCDVSQAYYINKKYLNGFKRNCTTTEMDAINKFAMA